MPAGARPFATRELTLLDLIDRILDKGVVINGDITVSFAGVDILSLKINLVIASLETAKRYGLELPWEKWEREKLALVKSEQGEKSLPGSSATGSSDNVADGSSGQKLRGIKYESDTTSK